MSGHGGCPRGMGTPSHFTTRATHGSKSAKSLFRPRAACRAGPEGEDKTTHQRWKPDERLRKMAGEGRTVLTVAEQLKRSEAAVRRRAVKLEIALEKGK